jgi:hypothetical protein
VFSSTLIPIVLLAVAGAPADPASPAPPAGPAASATCSAPPDYYAIELVTTRNIPGTGYARGTADVTFQPAPFGVSVAADGSYRYDVRIRFDNLRPPRNGTYVAWLTTTELDQVVALGPLDREGRATGPVTWNKFIVVVTLEDSWDSEAPRWTGPVAFRGMSRSGKMHTMIGHGPLQDEKCAAYGYAG